MSKKSSAPKPAPKVRSYLVNRFKEHARTRAILAIKSHPEQDEVEIEFAGKVTLRLNSAEARAIKVSELIPEVPSAKPEQV